MLEIVPDLDRKSVETREVLCISLQQVEELTKVRKLEVDLRQGRVKGYPLIYTVARRKVVIGVPDVLRLRAR